MQFVIFAGWGTSHGAARRPPRVDVMRMRWAAGVAWVFLLELKSWPPNQPAQPQSSVTVFATSPLMIATMAQALSSHSLRFTGQRLQAHAQHLQALAQCESLQDLFAQQMAFISETARQFSDVMARAMQAQPPAEAMPPEPGRFHRGGARGGCGDAPTPGSLPSLGRWRGHAIALNSPAAAVQGLSDKPRRGHSMAGQRS